MQTKSRLKKRKPVIFASIAAMTLFVVFSCFILLSNYSIKQSEILDATHRFMTFESKVERLVYSNVTLLQGYESYIKSNPNLNEESAYRYLDDLISENAVYIHNIGVIQDTTIIWNYPIAPNVASIGVDLSKNEQQRDAVLKVKTELIPTFQGPVNLVQGGSGFIVRLPIVKEDTGYWGQISIVLNSDKLLEVINTYAEDSGLTISIYNQQNKDTPFYGAGSAAGSSVLSFAIDPDFINWKANVYLQDGWSKNLVFYLFLIALSAGISVFVGVLVYKNQKASNKILYMSTHDSLTGLFNRYFLDEYKNLVLSAAKRSNRKVGIMLLDLNHFKDVNDTYGHGVGDLVLVEASKILEEMSRTNEAAFRLGGDEFMLIFPEIENAESLQIIKERLLNRLNQDLRIAGHIVKVTLSIGCAVFPEDGDDIDMLIQKADERMYQEKSAQ